MSRELFRLPVGPAVPQAPATLEVPFASAIVPGGLLPDTEQWDLHYGGPWLLVTTGRQTVEAPAEFFLRELLSLNANDDGALVEWCGNWGVPALPRLLMEEDLVVRRRHDITSLFDATTYEFAAKPDAADAPFETNDSPRQIPGLVTRQVIDSGARSTWAYEEAFFTGPGDQNWDGTPLAVVRTAVQVLQALVRWWAWVVPSEITAEWLRDDDPDAEFFLAWMPFGYPMNQFDGLLFGIELLNSYLEATHPLHLGVVTATSTRSLMTSQATVTDLVTLELTRFVAEKIPARICANETCGRAYVRQTGRAKHGQHRTSATKYCSDRCARAQAQREYRRREAAKARREQENSDRRSAHSEHPR